MCLAQIHTKGLHWHPHRLIKDRSTFPTYQNGVDFQLEKKVLRFPLLRVAGSKCLLHSLAYSIRIQTARIPGCCMYSKICYSLTQKSDNRRRNGRSLILEKSCILVKNLPEEQGPAPTELPKRFPNHPRQPTVYRSQRSRLPVQRLSQPEPRSRLPVRVDGQKATPCQGRAGGGGERGGTFIGAQRRALTGVADLRSRTGGSWNEHVAADVSFFFHHTLLPDAPSCVCSPSVFSFRTRFLTRP